MKLIPIPGEWGILGMMQVLGFFVPIPAIPENIGNGNRNSREFSIPRTSLVLSLFSYWSHIIKKFNFK